MSYEEYWIERANNRISDRQQYLSASIAEIDAAYHDAIRQINKDINKLLGRYMLESGLSKSEVKKLLAEEINISDENAGYYRQRISRMEALKQSIARQMSVIADKEYAVSTKAYKDCIREEYLHNIFDTQQFLGFAYNFSELPERIITQILKNDWSGKHYSERIWGNIQTISHEIEKIILEGMMRGTNSRKMAEQLNDLADTGMYACERLIRTETTYFTAMADLEAAKGRGVKKIRFAATLDTRTSPECRAADGKIIDIEDAVPGKNVPPLHPFCRSVIIDVIDGLVHKVRKARDPVTGKNYNVPADMTYKEWKKLPIMEKALDIGKVKGISFSNTAGKTNISAENIDQIKKAVADIGERYDLQLDYFEIGNYTDSEHLSVPMFYKVIDENGAYRSKLIINNACSFWQDEHLRNEILGSGYFAGETIEEFVYHEIAHVLTYQGCNTISEYRALERETFKKRRFGISEYANDEIDGAEAIAELFVQKQKGIIIRPSCEKLLDEYTEVWRR